MNATVLPKFLTAASKPHTMNRRAVPGVMLPFFLIFIFQIPFTVHWLDTIKPFRMARKKSHYADVLRFWRSIETFGLPDIPDPKRLGPGKELYKLEPGEELPWEHEDFAYAEQGK